MAFDPQKQYEILANRRASKGNKLDSLFWAKTAESIYSDIGSIDTENKSISFPTENLKSKEQLWNDYLSLAQSQGVRPDYAKFAQTYMTYKLKTIRN